MTSEAPRPVDLIRAFSAVENTSYILSTDLRIVRVNEGWTRFAESNGGHALLARWGRGSHVLDAIAGELRAFYRDLFERAFADDKVICHDYDCSSDRVERLFRMMVFPLGATFLAVTHSLRVERSMIGTGSPPSDIYVRDGIIQMCAQCRRVLAQGELDRWDWVPAYIQAPPPNVSHGLCSPCARFYFPDTQR